MLGLARDRAGVATDTFAIVDNKPVVRQANFSFPEPITGNASITSKELE
jgi:hypothetical protein